jgi:YHS domain-containing protein
MSRFFIQLLVYLVLFLVLRAVLTSLFSSSRSGKVATRPASSPPATGELKKDPVCGTYVSASASLSRTVNGETLYFCSPECRDKYLVR